MYKFFYLYISYYYYWKVTIKTHISPSKQCIDTEQYFPYFVKLFSKCIYQLHSFSRAFLHNFKEIIVKNNTFLKNSENIEAVWPQSWYLVYIILRPVEILGKNFTIFINCRPGDFDVWKWRFFEKMQNLCFWFWHHSNNFCQ